MVRLERRPRPRLIIINYIKSIYNKFGIGDKVIIINQSINEIFYGFIGENKKFEIWESQYENYLFFNMF